MNPRHLVDNVFFALVNGASNKFRAHEISLIRYTDVCTSFIKHLENIYIKNVSTDDIIKNTTISYCICK